jgi:hypothetical protein
VSGCPEFWPPSIRHFFPILDAQLLQYERRRGVTSDVRTLDMLDIIISIGKGMVTAMPCCRTVQGTYYAGIPWRSIRAADPLGFSLL